MDVAPHSVLPEQVAKASQGHFPLPFWISDVKNRRKDNTIFDLLNFDLLNP
jgi:hypothetical protein